MATIAPRVPDLFAKVAAALCEMGFSKRAVKPVAVKPVMESWWTESLYFTLWNRAQFEANR